MNFYAAARAACGVSEAEISGSKLGEIVNNAASRYPKLSEILPNCSFLVNGYAQLSLETDISASDTVDILPRFAGGA